MITVGQQVLTLKDFSDILINKEPVVLSEEAIKKVDDNFQFLKQFSSNKLIYGINTGFGPMAQYKVSGANLLQLQYNLIRSHSSGSGAFVAPGAGKGFDDSQVKQFNAGLLRRTPRYTGPNC